ncbi:serine/arginine-rich splicing factor 7-like [Rhynchonycteris naso]
MSYYGRYGGETKVYVGNLGTGAGKGELERAFSYYGPLRTMWIARNPPGFAFVEFEDPRDAEDAERGLDGKVICGSRVRVELSTGMPQRSSFDRPPARHPFDPSDRCYECGDKGHYAYDSYRYSWRRRSSRCLANLTIKILLDLEVISIRDQIPSSHLYLASPYSLKGRKFESVIAVTIPFEVKIKIQVSFTTEKQPIKVQISISKKKVS